MVFSISGLTLNLIGVLLLFIFGMPFRVETKGRILLALEQVDENEIKTERMFRVLGYVGFAAVIGGTVLQILGAVLK
jgi:hypothetical protein